jgi:hypothetical protein
VTSLGGTSNYTLLLSTPNLPRNTIFHRQRANPGRPSASVTNPPILPSIRSIDAFFVFTPTIPPSCLPQFYFSAPSPTTRRTNLRVGAVSISTCLSETQEEKEPLELEGGDLAVSSRSTMSLLRPSSKSVTRLLCLISTPTGQMLKVYRPYRCENAPVCLQEPHADVNRQSQVPGPFTLS